MDFKEQLEKEGFIRVYEWTDPPGTIYPFHAHKGKVSFYVTKGEIAMDFPDKQVTIKEGERMDVPVGVQHTAKVGSEGCAFVVGEEIEGDS